MKILVIDEADRMLGSDFESVIEKILCIVPSNRQTLLFSATMTDKVGFNGYFYLMEHNFSFYKKVFCKLFTFIVL